MKQKKWYENILTEMKESFEKVRDSLSADILVRESDFFERQGNFFIKSLPEEDEGVYYIIEKLEKMIESSVRSEKLQEVFYDYLVSLVQTIRMIFFKTLLIDFFTDKKDVKIVRNDETEVIIIAGSLNAFSDPITGRNPEKEDVEVYFKNIKLKGGITPYKKVGVEFIPG